jgi:hypothetical protein
MATTSGIGNVNEEITKESEKEVKNDAIANEVLPSSTLSLAAKMEEKPPNTVEMSQFTEEEMAQSSTPTAAKRARQQRQLRLAVAGCSHGQMDTIYERLNNMERQRNVQFDLLICCGDFQVFPKYKKLVITLLKAIRNHGDLHYYHAPPHHRKLGTFYKYYSGEKVFISQY